MYNRNPPPLSIALLTPSFLPFFLLEACIISYNITILYPVWIAKGYFEPYTLAEEKERERERERDKQGEELILCYNNIIV